MLNTKTGFSTYNIASANTDAGTNTSDTSGIRDATGTSKINNNANNKNAYVKANFSTYNIINANTDIGIGDAIVTDKKIDSNINNIDVS